MIEVASQVASHVDEFDRLVLVAPSHALHDLREALGDTSRAKMVGTLAMDLTNTSGSAQKMRLTDHGGP